MRLGADFLGKMRAGRFDLVVDLQGLFRSGFMTIATGAKRRIGLSTAREGARWSYTDVVPVSDRSTIHAVDRYWLVADALGVGHISKRFDVPVNGSARAWARQTLEGLPRPLIMIGAGSRWRTKRWPPSHFAALANDARNLFGGSIVLVGSKDETNLASAVNRLLPTPAVNLTGATTLPQLAAVLALADVMIANDTGPLHLAAALGRPVVAPYTCTTIQRTGPYGDNGHAVETSVWCAGSYQKRCDRLECMAELTPARLWPAVFEVLSKWQERRASA
jgi:ADP-heptose:LPS heptosyltransferase